VSTFDASLSLNTRTTRILFWGWALARLFADVASSARRLFDTISFACGRHVGG
jgi:hypothetical protein